MRHKLNFYLVKLLFEKFDTYSLIKNNDLNFSLTPNYI